MTTTAQIPADTLHADCEHCGQAAYRVAVDAPTFHSDTGEAICPDRTPVVIAVECHFTMDDLERGWDGDREEMAASVIAALHEVIGDDGGAYPPRVVWTNK